ncbi:MAG: hypothetical protein AAGG68_21985 [Bacteroidota bacterium]
MLTTGHRLGEEYAHQYFAIGLEFDKGNYLAYKVEGGYLKAMWNSVLGKKYDNFKLTSNFIESGHTLLDTLGDSDAYAIIFDKKSSAFNRNAKFHSMGATVC